MCVYKTRETMYVLKNKTKTYKILLLLVITLTLTCLIKLRNNNNTYYNNDRFSVEKSMVSHFFYRPTIARCIKVN